MCLQVVRDFRKLKQLDLSYLNSKIDLMEVSNLCKSLEYLTISFSYSDHHVAKPSNLTNLVYLDLFHNEAVDDELLVLIGAICKLLKKVDIGCKES